MSGKIEIVKTDAGQYAVISVLCGDKIIKYQLKADDEGLALDAVTSDGLESVCWTLYAEHPEAGD